MKKSKWLFILIGVSCFSTIFLSSPCVAQRKLVIDTSFYTPFPDKLILRLYLSSKFAPFTISSSGKDDLNYKTNKKLNLGAGFTYKIVTINLAYGFNFLNPDNGRGNTKGLDLQLHIYPHKWAVDLLGVFLKGYYLEPAAANGLGLTNVYQRPELSRNITGLSVYRVANADRFSYRAAFNQYDWQKKSAGSLLYGAEAYYGTVKGDSAFVPSKGASIYSQAGINKINFFSIGPGIGYAYTKVISKHFFITGSAIASVNVNFSSEENDGKKNTKLKVIPGGNYKAALGYNSPSWSASANLIGNALYASSAASHKEYFLPTGSVNLVVAKRIAVARKNRHRG
jgi:Domain of unknown function (DUF4421)